MRLEFLGADHEVTGSCHMMEACGKIMLVDYGMEQGPDYYKNREIPVAEAASGRLRHGTGTGFVCKSGNPGKSGRN